MAARSASADALLNWVNSFNTDTPASSLEELSSGEALLGVVKSVIPETIDTGEPWNTLWKLMEEYCSCSIEKSVSMDQILQGEREHIARVVVLLLAMAVERKPNEEVIMGIQSLDFETQRDLMFFIEESIGKLSSHAILAGAFTSGVGDSLPALPNQPPPPQSPPSLSPQSTLPPSSSTSSMEEIVLPSAPLHTPVPPTPSRKPPRSGLFYMGLESPAALRWLQSPAICRSRKKNNSENWSEEISRLSHRVRVLEKALHSESALSQELHTELLQKTQDCAELESRLLQGELKLQRLQQLEDTNDELQECKLRLQNAEASLSQYKSQVESLQPLKEKVVVLDKQLKHQDSELKELEELRRKLDWSSTALFEQAATIKRFHAQQQTTEISLNHKLDEVEGLLQHTEEYSRELKFLRSTNEDQLGKVQRLEQEKAELQSQLVAKEATLNSAESGLALGEQLALLQRECKVHKERAGVHREEMEALTGQLGGLQDEFKQAAEARKSLEKRYRKASLELEKNHHDYSSKLEEARGKNRELQVQQEVAYKHLCEENRSLLQKQTRLYEELQSLKDTQEEATSLCKEYESALKKERTKVNFLVEQIGELKKEESGVNKQLECQLRELRKTLQREKQRSSKLVSENKSLDAQLSYASRRLRETERAKNLSPPPSRHSVRSRASSQLSTSSYEPRTSQEEFYSQLQREFDDSTSSELPLEIEDLEGEEADDNSLIEDQLMSQGSLDFSRSTVPVPFLKPMRKGVLQSSSTLEVIQEDEEEDDRERIGELQRRNARALPHLKSSYPIEMQVQPDSPSISDDRLKHGTKQKRPSQLTKTATRPKGTAFEITFDSPPSLHQPLKARKRSASSRRKADETYPVDTLIRSPLPSRRRISAPPTPQSTVTASSTSELRSKRSIFTESRRFTMAPSGFKLREFLKEGEREGSKDRAKRATAFEVSISPPKAKPPVQKQLKENANTTHTITKPRAHKSTATRCTSSSVVVKPKSRKPILNPRN